MANPFLMDDDLPIASEAYVNPFLMQHDDEEEEEEFVADNPFLASQATNPFAAFDDAGAEEEILTVTTSATSVNLFGNVVDSVSHIRNNQEDLDNSSHFFDTTIIEDEPPNKPNELNLKNPHTVNVFEDSGGYSSEEELKSKKRPPPPPRPNPPPSKATQDLIMSVANELDQTSSHLLDRIPRTRTPSPVSMRDLHSPSPTPDMGFSDFMDTENDYGMPELNQQSNNFFQDDLMGEKLPQDNPFSMQSAPIPPTTVVKEDPVKKLPSRPPPPRPAPPSRPSPTSNFPPSVPSHPHVQPQRPPPPSAIQHTQPVPQSQQPPEEPDLFDMFGSDIPARPPKPPAPKSKEDILSLYSTAPVPKQEQNVVPDLLSGDILDNVIPMSNDSPQNSFINDFVPVTTMSAQPESVVQNAVIETQAHVVEANIPAQITPPEELENRAVVEEIIEPIEIDETIPQSITPSRADIFNMTVTCEPDNPPSDEEDPYIPHQVVKAQQEAAAAAAARTPVTPTSPYDAFEISEPIDGSEPIINPFTLQDEAIEPIIDPLPIYQPPPTPATGVEIGSYNDLSNGIYNLSETQSTQSAKFDDEFDAFAAKFDSADTSKVTNVFLEDSAALSNGFGSTAAIDAWGDISSTGGAEFNHTGDDGFGKEEFDPFLAMSAPPESAKLHRNDSKDSDETKEFNVFIRPKEDLTLGSITPVLAPPPKSSQNNSVYSGDSSPRFNPFDKGFEDASSADTSAVDRPQPVERTDSQESPTTPLFDDDVSQPLEDFPRISYTGEGWEMQLRQPNKKRITANRFWKKIHLKLTLQGDNPVLQLFNGPTDKEPFQELPLQACYSVSDISAQQYDQFGKIFTVKLQYIFYKERPGVRPGQVTKAERLTSKLSQFAAYAIQGDYQGVKEFGSDLKKLGIPVEHAPQVSELFKLGSLAFEDMKQFSVCIEEALFKLDVHRDRALNYKTEEVQITAVDEIYVEQNAEGHVLKQIARVRLHFLAFLSGMPSVELGLNDLWRQGKEVVGRHDIIPVVTEEWIRLEGVEFHSCVNQEEYERTRTIKFQPPDACYIELMRFRVRPPKNRELPLQLKATWCVTGNKVELRADILVPGFASRKLGQIPCEDVMIRFPIPECWIYLFRVEKHFRYGSVKSAHRRTGKVKGIERILGAVDQLQESLIEVTSGSAKYEHQHRALVWRCPRLPKEGQGAYTTHQLVCRLALTSYDQIPEMLAPFCYVEFTMPATQVSHTTVRSVSIQESDSDEPPEKYVRYLARHEYKVGIEHTTNETSNPYLAATQVKTIREEPPAPPPKPAMSPIAAQSDSDSDSN